MAYDHSYPLCQQQRHDLSTVSPSLHRQSFIIYNILCFFIISAKIFQKAQTSQKETEKRKKEEKKKREKEKLSMLTKAVV